MKPFLLIILVVLSFTTSAKPSLARMTNVQVDSSGNLTSPDIYHFLQGTRYYNKGDKHTALQRFKFAAEFGSRKARNFIGLMYLDGDGVTQNLILGQAWLKLAADYGDKQSVNLYAKFEKEQSPQEKKDVEHELKQLKIDYGKTTVLNNVYKFMRRFRFQTLDRPNTIKFDNKNVVLNELKIMRLSKQIRQFYFETNQKIGTVEQGEIILK